MVESFRAGSIYNSWYARIQSKLVFDIIDISKGGNFGNCAVRNVVVSYGPGNRHVFDVDDCEIDGSIRNFCLHASLAKRTMIWSTGRALYTRSDGGGAKKLEQKQGTSPEASKVTEKT